MSSFLNKNVVQLCTCSEEHQSLNQKMTGLKGENKSLSKEVQSLRKDLQKAKKDIEVIVYSFRFAKGTISEFPLRLEYLRKWDSIPQSKKSRKILTRLKKSGYFIPDTGKVFKKY